MKIGYKFGVVALAALAVTSCETHDPYGDIMEVGQALPTVTWALGSTVATAGDDVEFEGKYYTDKDHTPDHAEVWSNVVRSESAAATLGSLTSSLKYTQTENAVDTVRASQVVATYPHSLAVWDGYEFVLAGKFPTSQTLKSLTWSNIADWDQARFDSYYPAGFQQTFVDKVKDYLTADSTYYSDLRNVYINYEFTEAQIQGVIAQHPELDQTALNSMVLTDAGEKSDVWYTKTTDADVVGYYYSDIVDGVTVYREVANKEDAPAGAVLYDVYESSPWLFCRYDDNVGGVVTAVRGNYMPFFKDLISLIPFEDWIYNSSDKVYSVTFTRTYSLGVVFKVVDTDGNVGYTTDVKEITLN